MKKMATELCGTDIGKTIPGNRWVSGPYDRETKTWPQAYWETVPTTILMITHKKNGNVNVRTTIGEQRYAPDDQVELTSCDCLCGHQRESHYQDGCTLSKVCECLEYEPN